MSELKSVINVVTMTQIPENALVHGVVRQLQDREAFRDVDITLNERIYQGDVFESILSENLQMLETCSPFAITDIKTLIQLAELAELIDTDYVMVTMS